MDKLLMIADDLTGALDAAVTFAREGIRVCVGQEDYFLASSEAKTCPVQVSVVESRHLPPEEAYRRVHRVVTLAREADFTHIYKKTDSALRGNIGAELAAVRNAAGEDLFFIPAYPKMGRVTRKGIHYIDGTIPVAESVFGADPFNPVRRSAVADVIRETAPDADITVYDAETEEDILKIASGLLKDRKARLLAGCAGFANVLPGLLDLPRQEERLEYPRGNLAVFCGSINPISLEQCRRAVELGAPQVSLMGETGWQPEEAAEKVARFAGCSPITVFDTGSVEVDPREADAAEAGAKVARMVSRVIRQVLERQKNTIPMIIGGDTLIAYIRELGIDLIFPQEELFPGTVLSRYLYNGSWHFLISKSGGFGHRELLRDIVALLNQTTNKIGGCI